MDGRQAVTIDTGDPNAIDCGAYIMLAGAPSISMRLNPDECSFKDGVYTLKRDTGAKFFAIFQHQDGRLGLVQR